MKTIIRLKEEEKQAGYKREETNFWWRLLLLMWRADVSRRKPVPNKYLTKENILRKMCWSLLIYLSFMICIHFCVGNMGNFLDKGKSQATSYPWASKSETIFVEKSRKLTAFAVFYNLSASQPALEVSSMINLSRLSCVLNTDFN